MNREEIKKYLKAAIDLETDVATQESIIQTSKAKYMEIKPLYGPKPYPYEPPKPETVEYHLNIDKYNGDTASILFSFFGLLALIVFVLGIGTVPGPTIIVVAISLLFCIPFMIKKNNAKKTNENNLHQYEEEMEQYKKEKEEIEALNQTIKKSYKSNLNQWNESVQTSLTFMNNHLSATKDILNKLYKKDFIYPKYHNLPALTSIYEYFITGRCTELEGAHGAYNMYEDEVRKDTVISQLNIVIENLEQIKNNQYMLYQQVKKISENTTAIKYELDEIRGYTIKISELSALNAYYSALTASNTNIAATFQLLNG